MFANKYLPALIAKRTLPILSSLTIALITLLTIILTLTAPTVAQGANNGCPTFPTTAATETELNTAITCFNAENIPGIYTLTLTADITLTASLNQINNTNPAIDLLLQGAAHSVDGQGIAGIRPFHIASDTSVTMQAITITGGTVMTGNFGGAIYNEGDLSLRDSHLINNSAVSGGGAVYNLGNLTVFNNTFISNTTDFNGGAIDGLGGLLYVTDSHFQENKAGLSAGAIWVEGSLNYIGRSTFISNTAQETGGAMVSENALSMGIVTISGNTAGQHGGGLAVRGLITLINSTISGNTAGFGGGISVIDNGVLNLNHVTLSHNTAVTSTGGISMTTGSTAYVLNTIVANSIGADCAGPGSFNDSRYNLFEDGSCITDSTSLSGDPNLAPLALNNGVPGVLYQLPTHALLPGSPAINAIPNGQNNCGSGNEDQRGVPRPQGPACDIGAFEAAVLPLTVTVNGSGSVNGPGINCAPDCAENFYESSSLTLTASAEKGFVFSGWSGDCNGTAVCPITMNSPKTVIATFSIAPYEIYLSAVFSNN